MKDVFSYETKLHDYAMDKMNSINNIKIYGKSKNKGSIISFNIEDLHFNDLAILLDKKNIAIRSGHHCAQPLMEYYKIHGAARMSFGIYNNKDDIDYFVESLKDIINILK